MTWAWLVGASFILVWIAEKVGVADFFPVYGATGLLVSMIILAVITGWGKLSVSYNIKKIKEKLNA